MKSFFKNNSMQLMMVLLAVCYIATTIFHPLQQDEGVFLTIGQNLANGALPYQDFFDHKPPGIYFLFATIYYIFGGNIIWYKIILILSNFTSAWLVYRIIIKLSSRSKNIESNYFKEIATTPEESGWLAMTKRKISNLATGFYGVPQNAVTMKPHFAKATRDRQLDNHLWAPIFFLWLTLVFEGQYLIAEPFVAFFLLLGTYLYLNFCHCEEGRRSNLITHSKIDCHACRRIGMARNDSNQLKRTISMVMAGIFFGLALLFKQTALLSIFAFIIYLIWQKRWKCLAPFLLGVAVPTMAGILYLWQNNILADAYQQIISYNFQYYPSENIFKVISLLAVPFLYTLPVWILFGFYLAYRLPRLSHSSMARNDKIKYDSSFVIWPIGHPFVMIALLALLPMLGYFGRHYPHYWLQSAPFVAIIVAWYLRYLIDPNTINPSSRLSAFGGIHPDASGGERYTNRELSVVPTKAHRFRERNRGIPLLKLSCIFLASPQKRQGWLEMTIVKIFLFFILASATIFSYNFLHLNYSKYRAEQRLIKFLQQNNSLVYAENQFVGVYFLAQKTPLSRYLYITEISDWSEQSEQKTIEQIKNNQPLIVWPADSNYAYALELQRYIFANYKLIFWQHDLGVVVYGPQMDNEYSK